MRFDLSFFPPMQGVASSNVLPRTNGVTLQNVTPQSYAETYEKYHPLTQKPVFSSSLVYENSLWLFCEGGGALLTSSASFHPFLLHLTPLLRLGKEDQCWV